MWQVYLLHLKELLRNRFLIISSVLIPLILYPLIYFGILQFYSIKTGIMEQKKAALQIELAADQYKELYDSLKLIKNLNVIDLHEKQQTELMLLKVSDHDGLPVYKLKLDSTSAVQTEFAGKIRPKLSNYFNKVLKDRIAAGKRRPDYYQAFSLQEENIADKNEVMTKILSLLIPMFAIIAITGVASAVAVEVTAGEKENKAAETLFVTPLSRTRIIWGKILVVTTFAIVGGLINFLALGGVVAQVMQFFFKQLKGVGRMDFDASRLFSPEVIGLILFTLVTVSFLGSVLFIGMSAFAKNRKEANIMISPMTTILTLSSVVISVPGLEGNGILPFLPVINVAMSLKMAIAGEFNSLYVLKAVVSSLIYLLICLKYILPAMADEDVLFGSTETTLWRKIKADWKK